jgi:16S rRNA (uracil1498-N3)-methyltransferase
MKPADEIVVLDNSGMAWYVRLTTVDKHVVQGEIIRQESVETEPAVSVTLYQGTLKGQKFEWVLQKGTELGISRFVPVVCQRSVVRDGLTKKRSRWELVIKEAAEQSGRGRLPVLAEAVNFNDAVEQVRQFPVAIMPWEETTDLTLKEILRNLSLRHDDVSQIALFIGPEGGFTRSEAELANQSGIHLVTLGRRILRAETASMIASAIIFYEI